MPSQEVVDEIRRIVRCKVAGRLGFTAWDVTQELRRQNVRGFHNDFKEVVHQMFNHGEMTDYRRELRDMGGPDRPWFYYHQHDYAALQYASQQPPDTSGYVQAVDSSNEVVACADRRGTVCVPSKAIRALGLRPGMLAAVIYDRQRQRVLIGRNGALTQGAHPPGARIYTVDRDCNVRITRQVFADAYCFGPRFNVDTTSDSVILTTLT